MLSVVCPPPEIFSLAEKITVPVQLSHCVSRTSDLKSEHTSLGENISGETWSTRAVYS